MTTQLVGSFVLIALAILFSPLPTLWTIVGSAVLLGLWWLVLTLPQPDPRAVRLLPGHALLFFRGGTHQFCAGPLPLACSRGSHLWASASLALGPVDLGYTLAGSDGSRASGGSHQIGGPSVLDVDGGPGPGRALVDR